MSVDMKDYIAYQQGYEAGKRDAASPWHRVEDELPKEKYWVLVWHTGYATPKKAKFIRDVIPEFIYDGGGGAWELDGWSDNEGKVTHWMPIEPPKEDE